MSNTTKDLSDYEKAKNQLQSYHTLLHNVETPTNKWALGSLTITKEAAEILSEVIPEAVLKYLLLSQRGWAKRQIYDADTDKAIRVRITDAKVFPDIHFTEASLDLLAAASASASRKDQKDPVRLRALGDQLFALQLLPAKSLVDCPLFSWTYLTPLTEDSPEDAEAVFSEDWVSNLLNLCGSQPSWVVFILPLVFEGWFKILDKDRFDNYTFFGQVHQRLNALLKTLFSHAKSGREDLLAPLIPFFVRYYESILDSSEQHFSAMATPLRLADRTKYLRLWAETMAYVEELDALYMEGRQTSSAIREVPLKIFMTAYENLWLTRPDLIAKVKPEMDRLREVI